MLKKASIFVICIIIVTSVLGGCAKNGNLSVQNLDQTTQTEVQGTADQKQTGGTDTVVQKTDNSKSNVDEKPVVPEKNPPGDIPDNQVFVKFSSALGGYEFQAPEGWARTESGTDVKFVDKFDGVQVKIDNATDLLSVDNIKKNQAAALEKSGRAVKINDVKEVKLSGGKAVLVSYDSNSEPDSVTNKQVRLENESFFYNKNGKLAILTLWAPLGADNVDQWSLISNSFMWR